MEKPLIALPVDFVEMRRGHIKAYGPMTIDALIRGAAARNAMSHSRPVSQLNSVVRRDATVGRPATHLLRSSEFAMLTIPGVLCSNDRGR
jgi:hypothetical protein